MAEPRYNRPPWYLEMSRSTKFLLQMVAVALLVATCGGSSPTAPGVVSSGLEQAAGDTSGLEQGDCSTPGNPDKTYICHLPPGNPSNTIQLCVDPSAVPAHLAHGDYLGECVPCPPDDPYCCTPGDPYCRPGNR